ncbi:MAG TPA: hypothetical protein PLP19_07085 [bacterium]|nr:hypothetical protein [bacterium]HPN43236.1 hypothetical protein [bacterium]
MKINPENPNISSSRQIERDKTEKAKQVNPNESNVKLRDRVELSGEQLVRTNTSGKTNPYSENAGTTGDAGSTPSLNVSRDTKLSAARLEEIKQRINNGYYDSEQVINSVAKLMFQDVKKVDKNI